LPGAAGCSEIAGLIGSPTSTTSAGEQKERFEQKWTPLLRLESATSNELGFRPDSIRPGSAPEGQTMKAETEKSVAEIEQVLTLLRRHL
jgi:hypothetical protein